MRIFNNWTLLELYCSELKQGFIKKGYKSDLLYKHITTVEKLDQNEMLMRRVKEKLRQTSISKVIWRYWNLLAINESLREIFNCEPITAFKQKNPPGVKKK